MKIDLIRKYKWGIIAIITIVIMLSASLSFCLWDDSSLNSLKASGSSGDYAVKPINIYEMGTQPGDDGGAKGVVDVGDIVTFGNYYQGTNETTKTPLRWRVVNIDDSILTLLAEGVVAFGSFWDDEAYYNSNNSTVAPKIDHYNQNYKTSTIREWLNSESRTDGNSVGFKKIDGNKKIFNGFLDESFSAEEQEAIIERDLGSMKGNYGTVDKPEGTMGGANYQYGNIPNQKVWLPSWTEIYGKVNYNGNNLLVNDYSNDAQFQYFKGVTCGAGNDKLIGKTTAFASTATLSNYTNKDAAGQSNSQDVIAGSESPVSWWLRSPYPGYYSDALLVNGAGRGSNLHIYFSYGGVRPAVCIAR